MINLSDITAVNVFFAWLSLVSTTLFLWATISLKKTYQKMKEVKEQEEKRWHDLEDKAQLDYQKIIQAANRKAEEIILQAIELKHESVASLQTSQDAMIQNQAEVMKQISEDLFSKQREEVNKINEENIKILTNVYKDIEESAKSDFANYKKIVQEQTFQAEKIAQDRINQEYQKLESEIAELKQKKLKELNDNINNMLLKISKEVIGKSLDISEHEDLVIKALDKAKKEGII